MIASGPARWDRPIRVCLKSLNSSSGLYSGRASSVPRRNGRGPLDNTQCAGVDSHAHGLGFRNRARRVPCLTQLAVPVVVIARVVVAVLARFHALHPHYVLAILVNGI